MPALFYREGRPMGKSKRVALGMSGGVDSSVSVEILKRAGYDVVGVTCVFQEGESSYAAARDAADVCRRMGVFHVVRDCTALFDEQVVRPFVQGYASGLTPSPCVGCNANAKFPSLFAAADDLGCDLVATGHYARIVRLRETEPEQEPKSKSVSGSGPAPEQEQEQEQKQEPAPERYAVMAALDARKDQSYMLAMLTQEQLSRIVFPLGAMTKAEVRIIATDLGLEVADKPESQDVCFIDGDYRPFLHARGFTDVPGPIVNGRGKVLGHHEGLSNYTVGQRKGIGVSGPEPYYVVGKRVEDHALVVGCASEAKISAVVVENANWQAVPSLAKPCEAMVKLRYRSAPAACVIEPLGNGHVLVRLRSPQPTTAPGQYAVFYMGATVLGGGMIEEVRA